MSGTLIRIHVSKVHSPDLPSSQIEMLELLAWGDSSGKSCLLVRLNTVDVIVTKVSSID